MPIKEALRASRIVSEELLNLNMRLRIAPVYNCRHFVRRSEMFLKRAYDGTSYAATSSLTPYSLWQLTQTSHSIQHHSG